MAEDTQTDDELDPDEQGEGGDGEDGGEEEDTRTLEELKAENAELTRRLNRSRTAKAREARAANRSKGGGSKGGSSDDDETDSELAKENAELKAKLEQQEARSNRAQASSIAAELGFRVPSHGVKLLDWHELDDPSDPDEVRAALRNVLKEDPTLKKSAKSADGGEGGSTTRRSFNDVIRSAAGRG